MQVVKLNSNSNGPINTSNIDAESFEVATKIPRPVWAIGIASMLLNISTVMVFGVVALYMKNILGAATGIILLLEGFFEAVAYLMKLFSGVISDYLRQRKSIIVVGFLLVTLAKPLLAFWTSIGAVITSRLLDRLGNGIQSTPRDALVGDLAPKNLKGACFGLRQSLSVAGSFLGGILGIATMHYSNQDFKAVFLWASIPAILGFILVCWLVKDPNPNPTFMETPNSNKLVANQKRRRPLKFNDLKCLSSSYWYLMLVVAIFMSARVGESILILHATQNFNMDQSFVHAIMILYNGTNSLCSYPIGLLSDRLGRIRFLALSFITLIMADAFLGLATTLPVMLIGVALWGVQIGMSQNMFLSLIADKVPEELRGTAIGFYYLISSLSLVIAGYVGGMVADHYSGFATFIVSGAIGVGALLTLIIFRKKITN